MEGKEFLFKLSDTFGVSGNEYNLNKLLGDYFIEYTDEIRCGRTGDFYAVKHGKGKGNIKIMIEAHADEIGLVVNRIDGRGFVHFSAVGGVDSKILPAQEVIIHGKDDIFGVIGAKPPHVLTQEEVGRAIDIGDMVIDIGMTEKEAASHISVGDFITIKRKCTGLLGDYITGKAMDNRTGICSIYECAKKLKFMEHYADIYFVATCMEEVGHIGAMTIVNEIVPDAAISVDVTFAERYNDSDEDGCGKGVEIALGPNIHPELSEKLLKIAEQNNIPYFIEAYPGNTGTNAWDIQIARDGIPTLLISIPIRYMHTPAEVVKYEDIETAGRLMALFVSSLKDRGDFCGAL